MCFIFGLDIDHRLIVGVGADGCRVTFEEYTAKNWRRLSSPVVWSFFADIADEYGL